MFYDSAQRHYLSYGYHHETQEAFESAYAELLQSIGFVKIDEFTTYLKSTPAGPLIIEFGFAELLSSIDFRDSMDPKETYKSRPDIRIPYPTTFLLMATPWMEVTETSNQITYVLPIAAEQSFFLNSFFQNYLHDLKIAGFEAATQYDANAFHKITHDGFDLYVIIENNDDNVRLTMKSIPIFDPLPLYHIKNAIRYFVRCYLT